MKLIKPYLTSILLVIILLGAILVVSKRFYKRFDLTSDKRYTLSATTLDLLSKVEEPIYIKVLLKGNIPPEYKSLQTETLQLLEEYRAINDYISFEFVNPLEGKNPDEQIQKLNYEGFTPLLITSSQEGKTSESYIFPWVIIEKGEKQQRVSLIRNKIGATTQEKIAFSVQNLEYALSDALYKLLIQKEKKIAVFFDIDGTLYRDSLMTEHFKKLIKYEVVDEKYWLNGVKDSYINWDKRFEDYDNYLFGVSEAYVQAITGLHKKYIDFATEQVMKLKADRVYKFTRDIIEKHKKNGHLIIFISGSPDYLVEAMGKKHHAFLAIGSKYIIEDEKFTGEVVPMWDADSKNKTIDRLVEEYNIDLNQSFAYGDTNGDYNMLRRVGNPVAMNPSRELLSKIKENPELSEKATILIERKDVIYKTKANIDIVEI